MTSFASLYLPIEDLTSLDLTNYEGVREFNLVAGTGTQPAQFKLQYLDSVITVTVMPKCDIKNHLQGFANYVILFK